MSIVSDSEAKRLILALAHGQGSITEGDALEVVRWAERARAEAAMLDLALGGKVTLKLRDGELSAALASAGQRKAILRAGDA